MLRTIPFQPGRGAKKAPSQWLSTFLGPPPGSASSEPTLSPRSPEPGCALFISPKACGDLEKFRANRGLRTNAQIYWLLYWITTVCWTLLWTGHFGNLVWTAKNKASGSNPAITLTRCVILGKSLRLPGSHFILCKMKAILAVTSQP